MPRNYFSQKGGPYFINNGFSAHDHDHKPVSNHEHIKPDKGLLYVILVGFGILLSIIGSTLYHL
jgi:hypothetical protein